MRRRVGALAGLACAQLAFVAWSGVTGSAAAQAAFNTAAPVAYLKDLSTDTVLLAKSADERIPPASMGKMMTVYVAFDMIRRGEASLDQTLTVRPETWRQWHSQGSTMFLSPGEQVKVRDLLHGIVTLSGNDACVVLAEGLAGTEATFVEMMNEAAKRIGLKQSRFANPSGWPDPHEYVSARDLAIIAERTIEDFPQLYKEFYGQDSFTWGKTLGGGKPITQPNRNPILGRVAGADGLKTGHTEAAGYGFTGSAVQNGRRLVMVVSGLTSWDERVAESANLMNWGFEAWKLVPLARRGQILGQAPVDGGKEDKVGLAAPQPIAVTLPRSAARDVTGKIVRSAPLKAPLAKGAKVAELQVVANGKVVRRVPLVAAESVGEAGFFDRIGGGIRRIFSGDAEAAPGS